jgi:hypothetical protein
MIGSTLLDQVRDGLPADLREAYFGGDSHKGVHLAIMREPFLSFLMAGSKTLESRFSINRVDPFGRVAADDLVLLKAGAVVGAFVVEDVEFRELGADGIAPVRREYDHEIRADAAFWASKEDARFASLIRVAHVRELPHFRVDKRDMRGWVVLRCADRELAKLW